MKSPSWSPSSQTGSLQRYRLAVGLDHLEQFLHRQAQLFGQLLRTRIPAELALHVARGLDDFVSRLDAMHRHANRVTGIDQSRVMP